MALVTNIRCALAASQIDQFLFITSLPTNVSKIRTEPISTKARTIDYWEVGSSRVDIGTTETGNGEISTNFVDIVCPISPL